MKKFLFLLPLLALVGCDERKPSSDEVQQKQQESILKDATASVGMPAIVNFRERKLLKDIYELRDRADVITYTYLESLQGKPVFLGKSIGYGLSSAVQFTNPQKVVCDAPTEPHRYALTLPQADPNGLFSPSSAEGTWVMMINPKNPKEVKPVFIEPRVIVSPFPLNAGDGE